MNNYTEYSNFMAKTQEKIIAWVITQTIDEMEKPQMMN